MNVQVHMISVLSLQDPCDPATGSLMRSVAARVCQKWLQMSLWVSATQSLCPAMFADNFMHVHVRDELIAMITRGADVHLFARMRAAGCRRDGGAFIASQMKQENANG